MRIAIYGAGSLGTILGAFISKAGVPIELINRNKAHVEALKTKGAQVVGTMNFRQPVLAYTPARNEHHLSRTQNFIVEECAGNPCMPFHAEYQVNDIRIVVMHRCSGRIAFHIKMAIYWIFITKRRLAGL